MLPESLKDTHLFLQNEEFQKILRFISCLEEVKERYIDEACRIAEEVQKKCSHIKTGDIIEADLDFPNDKKVIGKRCLDCGMENKFQ